MKPLGWTQVALAKRLAISLQRLNGILNGHRSVTADTALLLAEEFGTTPQLWLNLQNNVDLWDALRRRKPARAIARRAPRATRRATR